MIHLILCGGHGRRLWPLSNGECPKSFLKFGSQPSIFQQTILRNRPLCDKLVVVANERHSSLAIGQAEEIQCGHNKFLWESSARDTAAAIALACFGLQPDEIVLMTPSDHWIDQQEEYDKAVERATEIAKQNYIAAISIRPTRPYEGYGYIRAEGEDVISFCEKPRVDQAVEFLKKSNWFWNSGIYCFKAGVLLEELRNHSHSIWEGSKSVYEKQAVRSSNQFSYPDMDCIPEESIDSAVIQKCNRLKMVLLQTGWSDIGTLEDLAEYFRHTRVVSSEKPGIFQFQSSNNVVLSDSMSVALIDVEDLIIVASKNGILISKRGSSHKVKHVFNQKNLSRR
ncbi:mannose-1-phosphate guanylyltransferase [Paenibacillus sp. TAF58]